jgi:hypothetical protein
MRNNPMQSNYAMHRSPRCGAKRRTGGRCSSPAMENGRCRMHGGCAPGAPLGNKNARKHGRFSAETLAFSRYVTDIIRAARSSETELTLAHDIAEAMHTARNAEDVRNLVRLIRVKARLIMTRSHGR